MRVLILGGSGMLGHKLWQTLAPRFDAFVTFRRAPATYKQFGIFDLARSIGDISANDFETVSRVLISLRPNVVVNCIGIVKQDASAKDPIASITVNSLFPHQVARFCRD